MIWEMVISLTMLINEVDKDNCPDKLIENDVKKK